MVGIIITEEDRYRVRWSVPVPAGSYWIDPWVWWALVCGLVWADKLFAWVLRWVHPCRALGHVSRWSAPYWSWQLRWISSTSWWILVKTLTERRGMLGAFMADAFPTSLEEDQGCWLLVSSLFWTGQRHVLNSHIAVHVLPSSRNTQRLEAQKDVGRLVPFGPSSRSFLTDVLRLQFPPEGQMTSSSWLDSSPVKAFRKNIMLFLKF